MKLFESGRIGKLQIKNRIVMIVNGNYGEADPDGGLSSRAIDGYVARAKGGAGLLTAGHIYVENEVENHLDGPWSRAPRIDSSVYTLKWSMLADAVHDYGAKLSVQLSAGVGRMAFVGALRLHGAVAPSTQPCYWDSNVMARELTIEEINKITKAVGEAAARLKDAGIDAVELHGGAGHLIDQFLSPVWNKRKDKYGGDLEGWIRFPLEIIASIKAAAGEDFPVIFAHSIKNYVEGGRDIDESLEMARRFEQAGVNAIHATAGCYEYRRFINPSIYQPSGCSVGIAETTKRAVSIPVIAFGKLGNPELAESVLSEGKADFVALARPLLADPEWPNKVREGGWDDIRPCIACHDGCLGRLLQDKYVSCAVNPAAGMEREFALRPAERCKSVLVVGGGPGGMEAAMVAASRGHRVTILEKSDHLGGNLVPASVPDFKKDLRDLIKYLSTQIMKLGVDVKLGTEATPELVQRMAPEVLIIATGATPIIPKIPGVDKSKVSCAIDVLMGNKDLGETVVVVGGGMIGCEVAAFLAGQGKKVTLIEMMDSIATDVNVVNRDQLMIMLAERNIEMLTNTTASEITDSGVIVNGKSGGRGELKADGVVLAMGLESQDGLQQALMDEVAELRAIGDCVQPRKVINAIWEGFRFARLI
ncbi:FAD-dependent oxidoreductase [Chloroflexota bacterium]